MSVGGGGDSFHVREDGGSARGRQERERGHDDRAEGVVWWRFCVNSTCITMSYYQQVAEGGTGSFGRHELIAWLNSSLGLRMSRIEDVGNGAAVVQIIDVLHPDSGIKLSRVNFGARDAYEIEKNYKILQHAFVKAGIEKKLEVERLIEGKPMALLGASTTLHASRNFCHVHMFHLESGTNERLPVTTPPKSHSYHPIVQSSFSGCDGTSIRGMATSHSVSTGIQ